MSTVYSYILLPIFRLANFYHFNHILLVNYFNHEYITSCFTIILALALTCHTYGVYVLQLSQVVYCSHSYLRQLVISNNLIWLFIFYLTTNILIYFEPNPNLLPSILQISRHSLEILGYTHNWLGSIGLNDKFS